MKKALLRFIAYGDEENSLFVKVKCFEGEGDEAPLIAISRDGVVSIVVKDFEIDYERSGKLWFNMLDFCFDDDPNDETGTIFVSMKKKNDKFFFVTIKSLDE
jgi:hypothetical protein